MTRYNRIIRCAGAVLLAVSCGFMFLACSSPDNSKVDKWNAVSYDYHYRNLDSTTVYARRALNLADDYSGGKAEAYNNLVFVSIARMDYQRAYSQLDTIKNITSNQIELLIADIQCMRLCQRQSKNKEFYDYRERAMRRFRRIDESQNSLTEHQRMRMIYARSEYDIVSSIYFYYVRQRAQSVKSLQDITPNGYIGQDMAQLLNYLYSMGANGVITQGTQTDINQAEFYYLMQCYQMAQRFRYPYWQAQALQALSQHLQSERTRKMLIHDNLPAMRYLNTDNMPDSLLAGNLAQRSLDIFKKYGDVYQIAGAYNTLAQCYWGIRDYKSALICLDHALYKDTVINHAPAMVAAICEQLCLVYSAMNNKSLSDYNRNKYLDIQEQTRQDRQLEARAGQLAESSRLLNTMIIAVIVMIFVVSALLFVFYKMRGNTDNESEIDKLLVPLHKWKATNEKYIEESKERYEEIKEQIEITRSHVSQNKKRNVEQRAKVSLVNSITPLIDRMLNEMNRLINDNESEELRRYRYTYIIELTDKINEYNNVLTQWIQMRQGELSLHIESFALQQLFDIVRKAKTSFALKDIDLVVVPCNYVVKADKALTLFMINTMADNARKFTGEGGLVKISATEADNYVEISVEDTGSGINADRQEGIFNRKIMADAHGFGLMNCKGIIDKYRKTSQIFSVCDIGVSSEPGKGSRFYFRLPKGVTRVLLIISLFICGWHVGAQASKYANVSKSYSETLNKAEHFAESMYLSNVNGTYDKTLVFADSCSKYLNKYYRWLTPNGKNIMYLYSNKGDTAAEITWFNAKLPTNYNIILNLRNEVAVAALALHKWDLYRYNNDIYADLFRKSSADNTLNRYVQVIQHSGSNKAVAVILLVLLLIMIFPAYYFLYYRYRLRYKFSVARIRLINDMLLSNDKIATKLVKISRTWNSKKAMLNGREPKLERVINEIEDTLRRGIEHDKQQKTYIVVAKEQLYQVELESDNLHICNSVLDNCLSSLKHETMYYPYRISQLVNATDKDENSIRELIIYYKELFAILSEQAMRQLDTIKQKCTAVSLPYIGVSLLGDKDILEYLFSLLPKPYVVEASAKNAKYVEINIAMPDLKLTQEQCRNLFQPTTVDVRYLVCRQIVRDIGEVTNARGCGMVAFCHDNVGVDVKMVLARADK